MTRQRHEIAADLVRLKETGYWRSRSGHTAADEADKFQAAKRRLEGDFKDDGETVIAVLAGDDDAFERRVDALSKSLP